MDMASRKRRMDLVERYNSSLGRPGPLSSEQQRKFIEGELEPALADHYAEQCEFIIASRSSMSPKMPAQPDTALSSCVP